MVLARLVLVAACSALVSCGVGYLDEEAFLDPDTEFDEPLDEDADDPELAAASEVDCTESALADDDVEVVSAHVVLGGTLGATCLGDPDATLDEAWRTLEAFVPPQRLSSLALFVGFVGGEAGDESTFAYVNTVDDDGTRFQMSVNIDAAEEFPDEVAVTLAHEFSHVLTSLPDQLDRWADPDDCPTYFNGEGCYLPTSIMAGWIEAFWADLIDEVDPYAEASAEAGDARCNLDPRFLGAYAASSPEEDFAETFAAFVMGVPVDEPEQREKLEWIADQPDLALYRSRAEAAGLVPSSYEFEPCGQGSAD